MTRPLRPRCPVCGHRVKDVQKHIDYHAKVQFAKIRNTYNLGKKP